MKYARFTYLFIIAAIVVYILSMTASHYSDIDEESIILDPPSTTLIGKDSIKVNCIQLRDSSNLILPMSIAIFPSGKDTVSYVYKTPTKIKQSFKYKLAFQEKINGYNIVVTLYPSDCSNADSGIADYHFSSDSTDFRIQTEYSCNWRSFSDIPFEGPVYGTTYIAQAHSSFIQENDAQIHDVPFCFKDVDFDGDKELCFRAMGFNRHYFQIYKVFDSKPFLLCSKPFCNIVYSDYPQRLRAHTKFNYEDKTIAVDEQFGNSAMWIDEYIVDSLSAGPFVTMKHKTGSHMNHTSDGTDIEYYENGQLCREELSYDFPETGRRLTAKYIPAKGNVLQLDSIIISTSANDRISTMIVYAKDKD